VDSETEENALNLKDVEINSGTYKLGRISYFNGIV
jgi:hypothetical protein